MDELFVICTTAEVQEEEVRGFVLARMVEAKTEPWPILITRKGGTLYGYENACPHAGSRLDTMPGEFMDEEGNFLRCGLHGALFDLDGGTCFIGPCQGKALTALPLIIDDGDICITDMSLTDEDGLDLPDPAAHPEVIIAAD